MYNPNDQDPPEEPMRLVYIREDTTPGDRAPWAIYDAKTQEWLMAEWSQHDAVDYCIAQDWDVRDGPVGEEDYPDDDPGFDPMFLM
jgi:hypothetical protein